MTVFLVIYKAEKFTAEIEYIPLENGVIEIVSFYIQPRPVSPFQERQAERRKPRRGIAWDEGSELEFFLHR